MSTVLHPGPAPKAWQLILNGIFAENPVFRLALSLCPAVAVTTTVKNGLLLGVAVLAVQVLSSVTVTLAKRLIHPRVRIPVYTIIIAVWVSAIDMSLAAFCARALRAGGALREADRGLRHHHLAARGVRLAPAAGAVASSTGWAWGSASCSRWS